MHKIIKVDRKSFYLVPVLEVPKTFTPLNQTSISPRVRKILEAGGVQFIEHLLTISKEELLRIPSMGRKGMRDIEEGLEQKGLSIGMCLSPPE